MLYNFLYERNGLYQNKVNIRFGFEFPLKKHTKKKKDDEPAEDGREGTTEVTPQGGG